MSNLTVVGVGAIGGLHLYNAIQMLQAGLINRIGVLSSNYELTKGNLKGNPQSNNFGIIIPDQIEKDVLSSITFFHDMEELATNHQFQNVIISSPTSRHYQTASDLAYHKKNVLIEKPACINMQEAKLLRTIGKTNKIAVAHELPYFPEYYALRRAHKRGFFDHMRVLLLERHVWLQNKINNPDEADLFISAFVDLVVHDLHFILSLGYCPISVSVLEVHRHPSDLNFISRVKFELQMEKGPRVIIDAGAKAMEEGFKATFRAYSYDGEHELACERIENGAIHVSDSGEKTKLCKCWPLPEITEFVPVCDFIAREQLQFLSYAKDESDAGPLDLNLGVEALELAIKIQNLALDESKFGQFIPINNLG